MGHFVSEYSLNTDPIGRAELHRRIQEAATWWSLKSRSRDPVSCLRSPELKPPGLSTAEHHWPENDEVREWVEYLARRRRKLLSAMEVSLPSLDVAMTQGRILGHDLDYCTYDDLAHTSTPFFDHQDNPGWDSWLHCLPARFKKSDFVITLSWIPLALVEAAEEGLDSSSTDCLFWVDPAAIK